MHKLIRVGFNAQNTHRSTSKHKYTQPIWRQICCQEEIFANTSAVKTHFQTGKHSADDACFPRDGVSLELTFWLTVHNLTK